MTELKELITALNEHNFRAFPQTRSKGKDITDVKDVKRCNLYITGKSGKDYFLSRAGVGTNDDSTVKYQWVRGAELKSQTANNTED